ncbi:hypothetical protein FQA39_LY13110 [Lamprigera yunnana]|nr:hypothetical protein FQA39_LY13110 [Lamprigera yunnana]
MTGNLSLSNGSLNIIMNGGNVQNPILQILGIKHLTSDSDNERVRVVLSDGKHKINLAVIITQIDKLDNGELTVNSVIRLKRYITSALGSEEKEKRQVLVVFDAETLVPGNQTCKIGDPSLLPDHSISHNNNSASTSAMTMNLSPINTSIVNNNLSTQIQASQPISSLTPYQHKWVIQARVLNKSEIKTWSNSDGENKWFFIHLIDETGEIIAKIFKDLVDKFYPLIENDKIYYIKNGTLKYISEHSKYNLKNDFEIHFTNETAVTECDEDNCNIPKCHYNFISIDRIAKVEDDMLIDVIGICHSASEVKTVRGKSTTELKKRDIYLVDQSNASVSLFSFQQVLNKKFQINLTLWDNVAKNFDASSHPVIVIKNVKVGSFHGRKSISLIYLSIMKLNEDIPEACNLNQWYDNRDRANNIINSCGFQIPLLNIKDVNETENSNGFRIIGTIILYNSQNVVYKACPNDGCKKKVVRIKEVYYCQKCDQEYPNFKYLLLGRINIGDWSGNLSLSVFSSEAERILGMSPQAVGEATENDSQVIADIVNKAHFKRFIFKCHSKMERYNDEDRVKIVASSVQPINYEEYNTHLISQIKQFIGQLVILCKCYGQDMTEKILFAVALLASILAEHHVALSQNKIVCYYDSKGHLRNYKASFNLSHFQESLQFCTHLIYGFGGVNPSTHKATPLNDRLDVAQNHYRDVTNLKRNHPALRVLLSIGGDRDDPEHPKKYLKLLESYDSRVAFIDSAEALVTTYGFDGIDLAWQFPKNKPKKVHDTAGAAWNKFKNVFVSPSEIDPKHADHRDQYTALVRDLKSKFYSKGLLVTMSVLPNVNSSIFHDVFKLVPHLDFITLWAFDYHTPQRNPKEADYTAPLYQSFNKKHDENGNSLVQFWLNHGCPNSKLIFGIPTFGRTWKMTKDLGLDAAPPVFHVDGAGEPGNHTKEKGLLSYDEVCTRLSNLHSSTSLRRVDDLTNKHGIYAFKLADNKNKGGIWVSFEDPHMAEIKATYARGKGLGGVAIIDLTLDDFQVYAE